MFYRSYFSCWLMCCFDGGHKFLCRVTTARVENWIWCHRIFLSMSTKFLAIWYDGHRSDKEIASLTRKFIHWQRNFIFLSLLFCWCTDREMHFLIFLSIFCIFLLVSHTDREILVSISARIFFIMSMFWLDTFEDLDTCSWLDLNPS